jgi:PAS domain-containing protein
VLYRVLQESLSNIVRHAQASEVCVGLCRQEHCLSLTVRDNGVGLPQPGARRGHGLRGIAQRVARPAAALTSPARPARARRSPCPSPSNNSEAAPMNGSQKIQHLMEFSQPDQQHGFALKLMELLVIPTFVIDIHGKVIIWNRACERLTGVPPGRCWAPRTTGSFYGSSAPRWPTS